MRDENCEVDYTRSVETTMAVFDRTLGGHRRFEVTIVSGDVNPPVLNLAFSEGQLRILASRIAVVLAKQEREASEDALVWHLDGGQGREWTR